MDAVVIAVGAGDEKKEQTRLRRQTKVLPYDLGENGLRDPPS
jgi:hypothetical protein